MKRILTIAVALCVLCVSLVACGDAKTVDPAATVRGLMETYSLTSGQYYEKETSPMSALEAASYFGAGTSVPNLAEDTTAYAIYFDASSYERDTEIGVFRLASGVDAEAFLSGFRARVNSLLEESVRYPFDTAALKEAKFGQVGDCVYYLILRDHAAEAQAYICR